MSRRRLTLVSILILLLSACTSEGLPDSYPDQDNRAETQFREACEESLAGTDEENPAEFCQCAFYTVAAELTFAEFLELDEKLKDDPGALTQEQRALLESVALPCRFDDGDITTTTVAG